MKPVALCLCLAFLFPASVAAQGQKDLVPDSLMNWLRIIELDGFKLIYASDDDGELTAISVDAEGDLLIANKSLGSKGNEVKPTENDVAWAMHIVDVQSGKDLWDETIEKHGPDSARITYTRSNGFFTSSITNAYPRGVLYPLKPYDGRKVRYEVFRQVNGVKETKLSYVLTLPERKMRRPNAK